MGMVVRVVVVDDQGVVRSGFAEVLSMQGDIDVVGEAANGRLGIEVSRSTHPDVVLMAAR
jgi:DNA-binding NarL/FixJ family response regulator